MAEVVRQASGLPPLCRRFRYTVGMRNLLMLAAMAALLAACGGQNEPGSATSTSESSTPVSNDSPAGNQTAPGNDAPADTPKPEPKPPPQPAAPGLPEMFVDGWYRAPGGVAIVQFPELPEGWTLKYNESPTGHVVTLGREGAFAAFTFLPLAVANATDLKLAQALAAALTQTVQKELPYMKVARKADELPHKGGLCAAVFLEGKSPQNVEETAIVCAVAEGKEAALCMCRTRKPLLDAAWTKLAAKVVEEIRVGKHVPKLPEHDPGTRLEGVYEGPTEFGATANDNTYHWLTFDKRGWCHESKPYSERELELDAMFQWQPAKCLRYRVAGGKLELIGADGMVARAWKYERQADKLVLDGKNWWHVSRAGAVTLDGHYEAFSFYMNQGYGQTFTFSSSSDYWFTKDGRFSFESASMSSLSDDPGWPQADGFRSWANAYASEPKNFGHYRVVGNMLQLKFADGRRAAKTIFLHRGNDADLVYIDSKVYLKDD